MDPVYLNAAVSRALVLDEYDEADRRSGLSITQAQRSTRHGTATPVHVTSPLTVDAAPPVVHSSPFSLSSPPPPPPPSPPLTPVPPGSSTLLMREELYAPSQLDASVPVIVHARISFFSSACHVRYGTSLTIMEEMLSRLGLCGDELVSLSSVGIQRLVSLMGDRCQSSVYKKIK